MDVDLASFERAAETAQPWPAPWPLPPFPPLDGEDLRDLQEGDRSADRTEAIAATASGAHGALDLAKESGLWRLHGFASFEHSCTERLGLGERTVEQRVAVERRLWEVPALREALHRRQLSYEQVRLLSHLPAADIPAWIPRAQELTCIELRRQLRAADEAQLRAAGSFAAPV